MWAQRATLANSEGAPRPPPFQLSGLFQLDDSYDACAATSVLDTRESIQGEKEGDDEKDT